MNKPCITTFFVLLVLAITSSITSYHNAGKRVFEDVNNALELTLAEMPGNVVSADTIRCYRNHLTIDAIRDTACISMTTVRRGEKMEAEIVADPNCGFKTILKLSDQRASCLFLFAGMLWLLGSSVYLKRHRPELLVKCLSYGGIIYDGNKFMTEGGEQIRLTPMQHSLLEMFMESESHCLTKQEICDRLWHNKPDASDTLYTLIRRIKPVIESNSNLKIESDRGKSYLLVIR